MQLPSDHQPPSNFADVDYPLLFYTDYFTLKTQTFMVKIIQALLRQGERGQFVSLELMGEIELVQSQNTGRFYATAKRCFISSTFDLETAKGLGGQQLLGESIGWLVILILILCPKLSR
jgi:hypothetical protein